MRWYFIKSPFWLRWLYPGLIWELPNAKNRLFLTFDDGPSEALTEFILQELARYGFKASFFLVGENCERYPQLLQKILAQGHQVGNHSFNHLNGWKTATNYYIQNVEKCQIYTQTRLFRPPYGKISRAQLRRLSPSYKVLMWSLMAGDFDPRISPEVCLQRLKKHSRAGALVVLHDNPKFEPMIRAVLPEYLRFCAEKGWELAAIDGDELG